jgi:hypothetical protein
VRTYENAISENILPYFIVTRHIRESTLLVIS